jgi:hypothetical protein
MTNPARVVANPSSEGTVPKQKEKMKMNIGRGDSVNEVGIRQHTYFYLPVRDALSSVSEVNVLNFPNAVDNVPTFTLRI